MDADIALPLDDDVVEPLSPSPSLRARGTPLAAAREQRALLDRLDLAGGPYAGDFRAALAASGWPELHPAALEVFQLNLGKLCNMSCRHCHVDAGPDRADAVMDRATVDACLAALDRTRARTVDLTGGAPELNPSFRYLVEQARARGLHVIDRCNLTVLLAARHRDLPGFLAAHGVEVVGSLPHCRKRSTDAQRGEGVFERSIEGMRRLNAAGYGQGDAARILTVVVNPAGAYLPGDQAAMEREWKRVLEHEHGVRFDRLIALTNMPIARYLEWLESSGNLEAYMRLLLGAFNPATVPGLMCRSTVSVAWDGWVYDCDFNQMLELAARTPQGALHIREFEPEAFADRRVVTARHCFGCTAGAGSSCGGSLV